MNTLLTKSLNTTTHIVDSSEHKWTQMTAHSMATPSEWSAFVCTASLSLNNIFDVSVDPKLYHWTTWKSKHCLTFEIWSNYSMMEGKGDSSEPILTIKLPEVAKLTKMASNDKPSLDGSGDHPDSDGHNEEDNASRSSSDEKPEAKNNKESSSKSKNDSRDGNKEGEEAKIDPILLRQRIEEEEREKMQ